MKEITRIHLARIAYDIEIDAKRELERYTEALAKHTDDEVMHDIESRMTELLAERGVVADGVVTHEDVVELRKQLGEPRDFVEEDEAKTTPDKNQSWSEKRLYRDIDNAMLGGVSSGVAAYFALDPVIVRVIFVVLLLITHGVFILVYALLWFIVPPARTAGQKLQMQGQPITAASIREFSESEFTNQRMIAIRKFVTMSLGVLFTVMACAAILAIAGGFVGSMLSDPFFGTIEMVFIGIGGGLFVWLMAILANMMFTQNFTPRRANTVALIGAGIVITGLAYIVLRYADRLYGF